MSDYLTSTDRYPANYLELTEGIKETIQLAIGDDPKFGSVSLCDVSAGYIQLNVIHADDPGHVHYHTKLAYDFGNAEQATADAIALWDDQRKVSHSSFYREGERYGWD